MYGRHFQSMYTGSMYGQGFGLFAVWGYVVSHEREGMVELNPKLLSDLFGESLEDVSTIINTLCSPDDDSRSKAQNGRRLVKIGQFAYQVVNAAEYAKMASEADRRRYLAQKQREHRKRQQVSTPVNKNKPLDSDVPSASHSLLLRQNSSFDVFWKAYPRKVGKGAARKSWTKLKPDEQLFEKILKAVTEQIESSQWTKNGGQYIPHPATWLNQERWDDEISRKNFAPKNKFTDSSPAPVRDKDGKTPGDLVREQIEKARKEAKI